MRIHYWCIVISKRMKQPLQNMTVQLIMNYLTLTKYVEVIASTIHDMESSAATTFV